MKNSSYVSLLLLFTGCALTDENRWWQTQLEEGIHRDLAREAAGEPYQTNGKTWADYWISRCELWNYIDTTNNITYLIAQRRQLKLPEIPEINSRNFRTPWQVFTNSCEPLIKREASGKSPPPNTKDAWQSYWQTDFAVLRANRNIGEAGVDYIKERREAMHLPPIKEKPKFL